MWPLQNFGWAIWELTKNGNSVYRIGWNGNHKLTLQVPTELSKMTKPYIYMTTEQWDIIPWVASQTDILAEDWEVKKESIFEQSL